MKLRLSLTGLLLAATWFLWDGPASSLGVVASVALVLVAWTPWARFAWLPLVALAVLTPWMPASFLRWPAWAAAILWIVALDACLGREGHDEDRAWVPTSLLVAALCAGAFLLTIWRPARASLIAPDAVLSASLLLAAVATAIAVFLVGERDDAA